MDAAEESLTGAPDSHRRTGPMVGRDRQERAPANRFLSG